MVSDLRIPIVKTDDDVFINNEEELISEKRATLGTRTNNISKTKQNCEGLSVPS